MTKRIIIITAVIISLYFAHIERMAQGQNIAFEEAQTSAQTPLIQASRETLQRLKTAEKLIQEKQYTDGVRLLWNLMKDSEDAFLNDVSEKEESVETPPEESPSLEFSARIEGLFGNKSTKRNPVSQRSLKAYIQQIIGSLPEEAREASELIIGTEAEDALEKALESGSIERLAEVSRNYYHTKAGYKASFLLGTALLYDGQSYSASMTLERLAQLPHVCAQFDPAFSILRLNSLILSGQQDAKKELVQSLRSKLANSAWNLENKKRTGFQNLDELETYLSAFNFQRSLSSASCDSTFPLLLPRWGVSTYESPLTKAFLDAIRANEKNSTSNYGDYTLNQCVFKPTVSEDTVVMRTIFGLRAIDRKTGKRLWNSSGDISSEIQFRWENCVGNSEKQALIQLIAPAIELRCRYDYTYGNLQSDSKHVYAIEDIWKERLIKGDPDNINSIIIARGMLGEKSTAAPNRLAAYDIKTGKLKWHIGSAAVSYGLQTPNEFDKVVFLGLPYPFMNRLYILGENQDQSIALYELDAQTGKKLWSQTLGEASNTYLDRMYNLTPCFSNGILICPTSRNSIAGIDLFQRRLIWGFVAPDSDVASQRYDPYRDAMMFKNDLLRLNASFLNRARKKGYQIQVVGNNVIYTPIKSENTYILNLSSGQINRQYDGLLDRFDNITPISTNNNQVVFLNRDGIVFADLAKLNQIKTEEELIEKQRQEKIRTEAAKLEKEYKEKGKALDFDEKMQDLYAEIQSRIEAQQTELTKEQKTLRAESAVTVKFPENTTPVGNYFLSDDSVFIPLSNNTLVEFNLTKREFVNTAKTWNGKTLGNLYLINDQVFSQTADSLECFDIKELFEKLLPKEKNETKDLHTLVAMGYVDWQNNKLDSALSYFKQAAAISPRTCQPLLKAFLFSALKTDFDTYKPQLDSLRLLISDPQSEFMTAQLQIEHSYKHGMYSECFDFIQTLINRIPEKTDEDLYCSIEGLTLHRDIWIGVTLEKIWRASPSDLQQKIAQWALDRVQKEESPESSWLLRQLDYFYFLPAENVIRQKLMESYKNSSRIVLAELQLRGLRQEPDAAPEQIARSWAQQAEMIQPVRPEHAAEIIRLLVKQYPDVPCFDNLTASAYIESLPQDNPVYIEFHKTFAWNAGQILLTEEKLNTKEQQVNLSRYYNDRAKKFTADNLFLSGVTVKYSLERSTQMNFVDKYGRNIMSINRDLIMRKGRVIIRSESDSSSAPWWSAEHLFLFSSKSGEISATNLLSSRPHLLWNKNYLTEDNIDKSNPYYLISRYGDDDEETVFAPEGCDIYGNTLFFLLQENVFAGIDIQNGRLRWKRTMETDNFLVYTTPNAFYLTNRQSKHIIYDSAKKQSESEKTKELSPAGLSFAQTADRYSIANGMKVDTVFVPVNIAAKFSQGVLFKDVTQMFDEKSNDGKKVLKQTWGFFDVENQKTLWKKEFSWNTESPDSLGVKIDKSGKLLLLSEHLSGRVIVLDVLSGNVLLDDTYEVFTPEERKAIVDNVNELKKKMEQEKLEQEKLEKEEEKDPQKRLERIRKQNKNIKTENLIPEDFDEADAARSFDDELLFSEENGDFYIILRSSFGYVKIPTKAAFPIASLRAEALPKAKVYKFSRSGENRWKEPIAFTDQFFYPDIPAGLPFIFVGCNRRESGGRNYCELNFIDKNTGRIFVYKGKRAFSVMNFYGNPDEQSVEICTEQSKKYILRFTDKAIPENSPREIPLTLIEAESPKTPQPPQADGTQSAPSEPEIM